MKEPILTSITTLLDITDDLIGMAIDKGARDDQTTAHDLDDLHSARLCIESAASLVLAADSSNREGVTLRGL